MRRTLGLMAVCCSAGWSAESSDIGFVLSSSLPAAFRENLRASDLHEPYSLSAWLNPFYLQGDFDWMDAWQVYPRSAVGQRADLEHTPPDLVGDALLVIKTEAASGLVYWTGADYEWYQQGD